MRLPPESRLQCSTVVWSLSVGSFQATCLFLHNQHIYSDSWGILKDSVTQAYLEVI